MHQTASLFHEGFGWISNGTEPNRKHRVGKCLLHVQNWWWTQFPEQSWLSDDVSVVSDDHQHTQKKEHKITRLITQDLNETNTETIWSSEVLFWFFGVLISHELINTYWKENTVRNYLPFTSKGSGFHPLLPGCSEKLLPLNMSFFSITFFFVIFRRNSNPPPLKFYHSFFNGLERNNFVFICCKGSISNSAVKSRRRPGRHSSKMDQKSKNTSSNLGGFALKHSQKNAGVGLCGWIMTLLKGLKSMGGVVMATVWRFGL